MTIGIANSGPCLIETDRPRDGRQRIDQLRLRQQHLHPRVFQDAPAGAFSLNLVYDRAAEAKRLWGLRHDGEWFHVGTPEALGDVEDALHNLNLGAVQR